RHIPSFARYVGVDYSGAETPRSSLRGLRVYMAEVDRLPIEVPFPQTIFSTIGPRTRTTPTSNSSATRFAIATDAVEYVPLRSAESMERSNNSCTVASILLRGASLNVSWCLQLITMTSTCACDLDHVTVVSVIK